MNLQSKHYSQIQKLIQIFNEVGSNESPLDRKLQGFFRKNKQFGSRDRKWTSAALYGHWRWYGWLRHLEDLEARLLSGYILDSNEITPLIQDWAAKLSFSPSLLRPLLDLDEKLEWIKELLPDVSLDDLNPDFIPPWSKQMHEAFQERACLWLRRQGIGRTKLIEALEEKEIDHRFHHRLPGAVGLFKRLQLPEFPPYQKGLIEVQDLHSQMVGHILAPEQGEKWLDLCAGSGGKALHLASIMRPKGRVIGLEIRSKMVNEARRRATRGFFPNLEFRGWDGEQFPDITGNFDGVLVDAPCSGSGTWRRAPDLRWRTNKEDLTDKNQLQLDLLIKGASQVKSGGTLAYVTCSIFHEENLNLVERFIKDHPFEFIPFTCPLNGEQQPGYKQYCPPEGDGIFIAKLKRK